MTQQLKHIVALVVFAAVAGGAYYFATKADFFASAQLTAADVDARTTEIEREVISQLTQVERIQLDGSVFSSPVYTSLVDTSVVLVMPDIARPDPFAPL